MQFPGALEKNLQNGAPNILTLSSLRYEATVDNDNAVRIAGTILDIPPGPRQRGYAKARVELCHLVDGRWRVYLKDKLLLETAAPLVQSQLRTARRRRRKEKTTKNQKITKAMTRDERIRARLTHATELGHT